MKLGGLVCIRNGFELDYCFEQAIQSLLPVCDMVTVSDGESTDGTQQFIREWMKKEPKIVLNVYPWPNPKGDANFWVDWLQYARVHTPTDYVLQLDADEILSDKSYHLIEHNKQLSGQFSLWCNRLNFWRDAKHLIPHGVCLAHEVIRYLPQSLWLPSDGADPRGAAATNMAVRTGIDIFHYGFLRRREAFFAKAKALQGYFFNDYDARLAAAETFEGEWSTMPGITGWENALLPFEGDHPPMIHQWLKDRGYRL